MPKHDSVFAIKAFGSCEVNLTGHVRAPCLPADQSRRVAGDPPPEVIGRTGDGLGPSHDQGRGRRPTFLRRKLVLKSATPPHALEEADDGPALSLYRETEQDGP